MSLSKFAVFAFTAFVLVACGNPKDPQKAADEGNQKIEEINANTKFLYDNYKINVMPTSNVFTPGELANSISWDIYSGDDRQVIQGRLDTIVADIDRVNEIARQKGVVLTANGYDLNRAKDNAQAYLDSLRNYNVAKR